MRIAASISPRPLAPEFSRPRWERFCPSTGSSASGGIVTRYAHCRSALVQRGDTVSMGQAIATVGSSGLATAPHLHFEVLVNGKPVDPINFIASTHVASDNAVH